MDAAAASLTESVDFLRSHLPAISINSSSFENPPAPPPTPIVDDGSQPPPKTLTDPTISGFLWKRGKRTQLWKQGYYAISGGCLCELAAPPPGARRTAVSLMPVTGLDISNRSSVKRAIPLSEILSCDDASSADFTAVGSPASGWARRKSTLMGSFVKEADETAGGTSFDLGSGGGGSGAASPASSRQFRVVTTTRSYVFRTEQVQESATWCEGLKLIAQRNTGTNSSESADRVLVVVSDEKDAKAKHREAPLSIYIKVGGEEQVGGVGTVAYLKERLVERRGLLPPQQRLRLEASGELLDDDDAPLTALLLGERLHQRMAAASGGGSGGGGGGGEEDSEVGGAQVLRVTLGRRQLVLAPVAGPDPCASPRSGAANSRASGGGGGVGSSGSGGVSGSSTSGLEVYNDLVSLGDKRWGFRADWRSPPCRVPALVVFHKRFPPQRNLVKLLTGTSASSSNGGGGSGGSGAATPPGAVVRPDTDPWWREHLVMVHVTPQPIRGEAHLTLVLEGTREALGGSCVDHGADMYERPLIYFCPKSNDMKWLLLEPALRMGFGKEGEGYETTKDRYGRDIWVIKRPPIVTEEVVKAAGSGGGGEVVRVLFTYVFRNPGAAMLMPVLRCCSKFRVLFQAEPSGGSDVNGRTEVYAKFEIQPALIDLL